MFRLAFVLASFPASEILILQPLHNRLRGHIVLHGCEIAGMTVVAVGRFGILGTFVTVRFSWLLPHQYSRMNQS